MNHAPGAELIARPVTSSPATTVPRTPPTFSPIATPENEYSNGVITTARMIDRDKPITWGYEMK